MLLLLWLLLFLPRWSLGRTTELATTSIVAVGSATSSARTTSISPSSITTMTGCTASVVAPVATMTSTCTTSHISTTTTPSSTESTSAIHPSAPTTTHHTTSHMATVFKWRTSPDYILEAIGSCERLVHAKVLILVIAVLQTAASVC